MTGRDLTEYRRKRRAGRTPEPIPSAPPADAADGNRFVVQEHHARALHWDGSNSDEEVIVQVFGIGPVETTQADPSQPFWVQLQP